MFFITKFRTTFKFLVIWRLISIFVIETYYVPDEYWQSLEVAHFSVFGYGYLTWEWRMKIRSFVYPFFISLLYKLLEFVHCDYSVLIIYAPRILQAIISGYADYKFFSWTKSELAVFLIGFNWFWYYCATRTLTNTLETSLTTITLSIFPWRNHENSRYLWIVGLMCIIRPTAAIIWTPLCLYHIINAKNIYGLLKDYLVIIFCTFCYSVAIDSYFYGGFTFTPWRFFQFNVLSNISDYYGKESLFWYLTTGLPVVIGFLLLYFPIAAYHVIKNWRILSSQAISLFTIVWTILIYSLLPHKEFRFILPLLPLFIYISTSIFSIKKFRFSKSIEQFLLLVFIIMNVFTALYIGMIHQRGQLDVMRMFRNGLIMNNPSNSDVMFLMPCHSTPYYSHLHFNVQMRFLTCEPNFEKQSNYLDEADQFFHNPMQWLKMNFNESTLPEILITYDNIVPTIVHFLKNYQPVMMIFNTHFPQSNCGENIIIYKRRKFKRRF